ncbi:hypothetical protein EI171_12490 [Bradyrhizobium sp. LCT2]|uniref:hypothetical protein n=1 Tax=Bradyrhizobium sp. LCT2 TaxID=2493093 RepID=UPI0013743785|nr:hypothetical protein [Bradyrhizobium sp. LCT2]QHP68031.1 hypothetical protein EI171_12490 [Bradyrhizobium sp. LCT2]
MAKENELATAEQTASVKIVDAVKALNEALMDAGEQDLSVELVVRPSRAAQQTQQRQQTGDSRDGAAVSLIDIILTELRRQHEEHKGAGVHVDAGNPRHTIIDGSVDLIALVEAIDQHRSQVGRSNDGA